MRPVRSDWILRGHDLTCYLAYWFHCTAERWMQWQFWYCFIELKCLHHSRYLTFTKGPKLLLCFVGYGFQNSVIKHVKYIPYSFLNFYLALLSTYLNSTIPSSPTHSIIKLLALVQNTRKNTSMSCFSMLNGISLIGLFQWVHFQGALR